MSYLSFKGVGKRYAGFQAVSGFGLDIARGELVAVLGPSGCGKTTSLRMLAGFVPVTEGSILLDGQDITGMPSYRRNIGMVFQGYALFPHMTVAQNVGFGLQMRRLSRADTEARVKRVLQRVQLAALADRLPRQLSGGQQQRVALARAMVIDPAVLLLDEPLSALDARLRHDVRQEIRQLQQESGLTTLMVTHDQDEALSMADRLVIMNQGRIEQIGTPAEVYEQPANRFVAEFMGKSNFLSGAVIGEHQFRCDATHQVMRCDTSRFATGAQALLSFRPERTQIEVGSPHAESGEHRNALPAQVASTTYLGQSIELSLAVGEALTVRALLPNAGHDAISGLRPGQPVQVRWQAADTRLLPA